MKCFLLLLCISICSPVLRAQSDTSFRLSEEASRQLIESSEYQNCVKFQNDFLDTISNKINGGVSLESIRLATLHGISTNNYNQVYEILFGNYQAGESFFTNLKSAQRAFIARNEFINQNINIFACQTCGISLYEKTNYFFTNFLSFVNNRLSSSTSLAERAPTCGSYWNQVLLVTCAAGCGVSTAGIGAAMCGWGCWCTFCTRNSAVANSICAQ